MSASVYGMKPHVIHTVNYKGHRYAVVFYDDRIGVAKSIFNDFKYMTVMFDYRASLLFPKLLKTRLKFGSTAGDLVHSLVTCDKLETFIPECITVCEHILKYGHGARQEA